MGSRSTKVADVVHPHAVAIASPTRQNQGRSNDTNGPGPCQGHAIQPAQMILSSSRPCDDINLETSSHETIPSRRRYSEPAKTATMAMELNTDGVRHLAAFESFIAERDLMAIGAVSEDLATLDSSPSVEEIAEDTEEPEVQCVACCAQLPKAKDLRYAKEVIRPCRSCYSAYCISCVKNMFLTACKDSTRMPPRCCVQIHLHYVKSHLTTEEVIEYKLKYEEWSTPKPFYCPTPTCSTFIPERLLLLQNNKEKVDSGIGLPTPCHIQCPKCESEICMDCRQIAHPGVLCANLDLGVDADTAALLKAWGYKRCPKCSQGLKRMYGCNHMECRCGAHFCWGCMKSRNECEGGCYEHEDDDDESDFEPDRPEPLAEENNNNDSDEARMENTRRNDVAEVGSTSQATGQVANDASTASNPTPRPRNLDGGSARYWEDEGLNFGEEPTDDVQDTAWNCEHDFEPYAVTLAEAISTSPLAHEMDCVRCWSAIQPGIQTQPATIPISAATPRPRTPAVGGRGGRRGRGRGMVARLRPAAYVPPRGLVRSDATVSTAPHLTARLPIGSPRHPEAQSVPMEGIRYGMGEDSTESETIAKTRIAVSSSNVFNGPSTTYSVAQECSRCSLIVCKTCADSILARQQAREDEKEAEEEMQPEEDTESEEEPQASVEVPVAADDDEQPPPSLFD
ncbi:IBR finger domain-containing protein [Stagonosporopsis vannaccii]|nr:IBR finger domain-containing protein [Stagonosporopsis vannaccii]